MIHMASNSAVTAWNSEAGCIKLGPGGLCMGRYGFMTVHALEWKRTDHGI